MDDLRQYHRITCDAKCVLYHAHSKLSGVILNISLSGVAIRLYDRQTDPMQIGEACSLILCNNPAICTYRYPVQVARIGSNVIGLQFVDAEA